jgi:hypothetical protein
MPDQTERPPGDLDRSDGIEIGDHVKIFVERGTVTHLELVVHQQPPGRQLAQILACLGAERAARPVNG